MSTYFQCKYTDLVKDYFLKVLNVFTTPKKTSAFFCKKNEHTLTLISEKHPPTKEKIALNNRLLWHLIFYIRLSNHSKTAYTRMNQQILGQHIDKLHRQELDVWHLTALKKAGCEYSS
ncbi:hypothetical protein DXT99_19195 [Pontibacter diazotrophicus]|uniref:Uncharacterized protein n=1 Tax=Pontibacter diazotrophicus TaxID=1400979 RepID=A0A3D8L7Y2_9BACT|nr:hypothetical protein DXT99_19195 [Pontibacter diazotrophicus]